MSEIILSKFFEVIVAPGFDKTAIDKLKVKKNLIIRFKTD